MKDPLSTEYLDGFFLINENNVLQRRESSSVEFKTEFDWKNKEKRIKYLKSMVAFEAYLKPEAYPKTASFKSRDF